MKMTEGYESWTVDTQTAAKIVSEIKEKGFKQEKDTFPPVKNARTRRYSSGDDEVIIAPRMPVSSGKKIVTSTKGASPLIADLTGQSGS